MIVLVISGLRDQCAEVLEATCIQITQELLWLLANIPHIPHIISSFSYHQRFPVCRIITVMLCVGQDCVVSRLAPRTHMLLPSSSCPNLPTHRTANSCSLNQRRGEGHAAATHLDRSPRARHPQGVKPVFCPFCWGDKIISYVYQPFSSIWPNCDTDQSGVWRVLAVQWPGHCCV